VAVATQPDPIFKYWMLFNQLGYFAKFIRDSQPFWANRRCCADPNSYKKEMQWDSSSKKKWLHWAL